MSNDLLSSERASQDNLPPDNPATGLSGFWAWLAIFPTALPEMVKHRIWTPDIVKRYQPVIRNILPQAVIQTKKNDKAVQFVVNKWKESKTKKLLGQSKDAPELTVMAKFLSSSLELAKNPVPFFLLIFMVLGIVTWIGYSTLGRRKDDINIKNQ